MYTNLFTGLVKDNNYENVATLIEHELIPQFQKQQGWKGWRLVINQDNNKLAFLTYWYSKEDFLALAESGLLQEQLGKIYPLIDHSSKRDFFDLN
ncbi:MAG: hypothetical protein ACFFDT_22595 [Candidatus Hodarchaeota archaeon]